MKANYLKSACSTPRSVFPSLLKMSTYHIRKIDFGVKFEKAIGKMLDKLNVNDVPFPAHLTLEESCF